MSKVKTKSSCKKRFKKTASGKIKASHAFKRHLLTKKSRKTKSALRKTTYINASFLRDITTLMPY